MRIRIGIRQAKELDLEVEDSQEFVDAYEKAVADGEHMVWIAETNGHRHGVVTELVAYIETEPEELKQVGFSVG